MFARVGAGISERETVLRPRSWQRSERSLVKAGKVKKDLSVCKLFAKWYRILPVFIKWGVIRLLKCFLESPVKTKYWIKWHWLLFFPVVFILTFQVLLETISVRLNRFEFPEWIVLERPSWKGLYADGVLDTHGDYNVSNHRHIWWMCHYTCLCRGRFRRK